MATATFTNAVNHAIDLPASVALYRANEAASRRLSKSRPTRNAGRTNSAIKWREDKRHAIQLSLLLADRRQLIGDLIEESSLLSRVNDARQLGQARPELKARLSVLRRRIAAELV